MNTIITFTLKDFLLSGVYIALIVLLIVAIRILFKVYSSIKNINAIVEENRKDIDLIIKEIPGITKNANLISKEVAHDLAQFRGTVDNIAETTENVTGVVKENNNIVDGLTSVFHTASIAKSSYDKFLGKEKQVVKKEKKVEKVEPEEEISEETIN